MTILYQNLTFFVINSKSNTITFTYKITMHYFKKISYLTKLVKTYNGKRTEVIDSSNLF